MSKKMKVQLTKEAAREMGITAALEIFDGVYDAAAAVNERLAFSKSRSLREMEAMIARTRKYMLDAELSVANLASMRMNMRALGHIEAAVILARAVTVITVLREEAEYGDTTLTRFDTRNLRDLTTYTGLRIGTRSYERPAKRRSRLEMVRLARAIRDALLQ